MEQKTAARLKALRQAHHDRLLKYPNVVGTGQHKTRQKDQDTGTPCVTILVKKKIPRQGLRTEEVFTGENRRLPHRRYRSGRDTKTTGQEEQATPSAQRLLDRPLPDH